MMGERTQVGWSMVKYIEYATNGRNVTEGMNIGIWKLKGPRRGTDFKFGNGGHTANVSRDKNVKDRIFR